MTEVWQLQEPFDFVCPPHRLTALQAHAQTQHGPRRRIALDRLRRQNAVDVLRAQKVKEYRNHV